MIRIQETQRLTAPDHEHGLKNNTNFYSNDPYFVIFIKNVCISLNAKFLCVLSFFFFNLILPDISQNLKKWLTLHRGAEQQTPCPS
jgi:hypothetical protein